MSLPEFSIRYPVTVLMLTLAVALLGVISLSKLGTDLLPNMHTPVITVDLQVPGKAPQEVEEQYTRRLERDFDHPLRAVRGGGRVRLGSGYGFCPDRRAEKDGGVRHRRRY